MSDDRTKRFVADRTALMARPGLAGPGRRHEYVQLVDDWLHDLFALADPPPGMTLIAVGGHGRRELAPGSDLDLVVLHDDPAAAGLVADRLWYPIWDSGLKLDHSVRSVEQSEAVARDDVKAMLGMLDLRLIAGDAGPSDALREAVLSAWRRTAVGRLDELRTWSRQRSAERGEVAYLLEPDLKEAYGGLRDVTVLRAIAASWLTDVPHTLIDPAHLGLLDVRDALHRSTGRATDRLSLDEQAGAALLHESQTADNLLRAVCGYGRAVAYASDLAWHALDLRRASLSRSRWRRSRRDAVERRPLTQDVVEQNGEALLARDAAPAKDPLLALRAAAAAAQAGIRLSSATVDRLAAESPPIPEPWPAEARDAFTSLLGAGNAALPVWESLDLAGIWGRWIPAWNRLRALPQHNPVHRFTVDRHLIEAAIQASALTRTVTRPDLLLVGALLHDVGKGMPGDHTEQGLPIVATIAQALGFAAIDVETLVDLCRHHLLLPELATRRDLDDPATISVVVEAVGTHDYLDLLHALTQADARATGPAASTEWRLALIADLVARTHAALRGDSAPKSPVIDQARRDLAGGQGLQVRIKPDGPVWIVTIGADDRTGLLSLVAGTLSLNRLAVRSATLETLEGRAVQVWTVQPMFGDPPTAEQLRQDLRRAIEGTLDIEARLTSRERAYPERRGIRVPDARVDVLHEASGDATVIEIRAHDGPALLYRIGQALAGTSVDVRAARVTTMGSEAVDVFYVRNLTGHALGAVAGAELVDTLRGALVPSRPERVGEP